MKVSITVIRQAWQPSVLNVPAYYMDIQTVNINLKMVDAVFATGMAVNQNILKYCS